MTLREIASGEGGGNWLWNQTVDALLGKNDVGPITAFAQINPPSAPNVAVNSTAGNLTGNYQYKVAFVTGYWWGAQGSGTLITQGNTGGGNASATVAPSGQQVNVSNIPIGPVGTVARIIYRTKANGSSYFQVIQINDNTSTTFSDNVADSSLTVAMPTSNTTGSWFQGKFAGDGSQLTNLPIPALPSDVAKYDVAQTWTALQTFSVAPGFSASQGTAPFSVTSTTKVPNLNADTVDGYNFNQSLLTTNSPSFVTVILSQATGTAPLTVSSTTVVPNLNVDMVDGFHMNQNVQTTSNPSFNSMASTVATGTAPLTVASTTKVNNLNVDMVDGFHFNQSVETTDSPTFVKMNFTQTTGTAPFTVASNTTVTNLSADMVDGWHLNQDVTNMASPTFSSLVLSVAQGTAPLSVTSTTKVTNLNADLLDGYSTSASATANTIPVRDANGALAGNITGNAATATTTTGNAGSATKLQTARGFSLTGDATAPSVAFDGTANIALNVTLANKGVANGLATLDGSGNVLTAQLGYALLQSMLGAANGVASLDANTLVPVAQIPALNYVPTSQRDSANGVAVLDGDRKVLVKGRKLPSAIRYWMNV